MPIEIDEISIRVSEPPAETRGGAQPAESAPAREPSARRQREFLEQLSQRAERLRAD